MRMSSKGRVTIPIVLRRRLELKPGDEIDFILDGGSARIIPRTLSAATARARAKRIAERMQTLTPRGMSTDEVMKLMRGDRCPEIR